MKFTSLSALSQSSEIPAWRLDDALGLFAIDQRDSRRGDSWSRDLVFRVPRILRNTCNAPHLGRRPTHIAPFLR